MIAKELISSQIAPLNFSDTSEQALTMMNIYHVKHLPLVNDKEEYICVLSEEELSQHGMAETLESISPVNQVYALETDHLFDVLAKIAEFNLTTIPVLDAEMKFKGIIDQEELLQFYANSFSFKVPGSIIVLEMKDTAYSLSEIARLVEGERATILSSLLTKPEGKDFSIVTLKVNLKDISKIVATLQRFGYTIKASFTEEGESDVMMERYDALMSYLNV